MQLGMIGLGRMGASMVRRLLKNGHACAVHDVQLSTADVLVKDGASGGTLQQELVSQLGRTRTIWLMVPAGVVDQALGELLTAYAEGLEILRLADMGQCDRQVQGGHDAENTPLRDPELYRFDMAPPETAEVWRRGGVIGSWLLDLTAAALLEDPDLTAYSGRVADSCEACWASQAAIDEGVPVSVLSAALFERFASRGNADFENRPVSAMRNEFAGHAEKAAS